MDIMELALFYWPLALIIAGIWTTYKLLCICVDKYYGEDE